MKPFLFIVFGLGAISSHPAQAVEEFEFAGGRKLPLSLVQVTATGFAATVPLGNTTQVIHFKAQDVIRATFQEPPELRDARDRIAMGSPEPAASQLARLSAELAPFRAVRGSWWHRAAILRMDALAASGKIDAALEIANQAAAAELPAEVAAEVADMKLIISPPLPSPEAKLATLRTVTQRSPDPWVTARARLETGAVLAYQGKIEEAVKAWLRVYALHAAESDLAVRGLISAARGLQQLGVPADGEQLLQGYLSDHPQSPFRSLLEAEMAKLVPRKPSTPS